MKERNEIEERLLDELANRAKSLMIAMNRDYFLRQSGPNGPDTADFRAAFQPFVRRALIMASAQEARKVSGLALTERMKELVVDLQTATKEENLKVSRTSVMKRLEELERELAEVDRLIKEGK